MDASVTAKWLLPDEEDEAGRALLAQALSHTAHVPFIWSAEVANLLLMAERRGRVRQDERANALALLHRLPVRIDEDGGDRLLTDVYSLAQAQGLTIYDALYLDLALRTSLPLASFDRALRRAAGQTGVVLLG